MRRMRSVAPLSVLAVLLSGCTGVAEPDSGEVQEWLRSQETAHADAAIFMAGLPNAVRSDTRESADGVRADFEDPTDISTVSFSCFGSGTMSVIAQVSGSSESSSAEVEVPCAETPITLDIVQRSATSVSVNAFSAQKGAWSAVVR